MAEINLLFLCDVDFRVTYFAVNKPASGDTHAHFLCQHGMRMHSRLFFVTAGNTHFLCKNEKGEKRQVDAGAGDIVYLPDDVAYESWWDDPAVIDFVSLEFALEDERGQRLVCGDTLDVVAHDRNNLFLSAFTRILDTWLRGELGYRIRCRAQFLDVLHMLIVENARQMYHSEGGEVSKGILYLENHYLEETPIAELARLCGMCESNFRSRFQKNIGMPPVQYRNFLRMKRASQLLKSGEYTVTEAAAAVNCPDVYYFSKMFKRFFGQSPRAFAQGHTQNADADFIKEEADRDRKTARTEEKP